MKVLVIQQRMGIGDMVIFLPYIHAISKKMNSPITLLASKNSRADELFKYDKSIKEILFIDRRKDKSGLHDGLKGFFRLAQQLKEKKFEKVFIFNSSLRYFLLAKIAGVKKIYQYPLFRKKDNLVQSAKKFTEKELFENVSTEPYLKLKESLQLENKDCKNICLGISASGPTKRWGIENYIKLCNELQKTIKCKFFVAGGKQDAELINRLKKSQMKDNFVSFEKFKITETLPYIKNCDLYIGNDTGWAHIACSLQVKSLTLFMDSPVMAYGKYSKFMTVIEPEGEKNTTTHDTLGGDRISFQKVLDEAKKILLS
mgnify:CR=1 FL=1|tara:strand:+ start:77 stop:1018 length:942 start_codon:yes stop_codon:yes gene_type:complete